MDIAQSFGSSSSYARKYALNGLFLIDDTKDADATNNHGKKAIQQAMNSAQLKSAKDYIKSGGKVEAIKAKYTLKAEFTSKKIREMPNKFEFLNKRIQGISNYA